ncbi:MAG: hypothetical protein ACJ8CB_25785 [Ktedonobacteraceae bacterium]
MYAAIPNRLQHSGLNFSARGVSGNLADFCQIRGAMAGSGRACMIGGSTGSLHNERRASRAAEAVMLSAQRDNRLARSTPVDAAPLTHPG